MTALNDAVAKAQDAKTAAEKEVVKVMTTICANTNLSVSVANPMTVNNDYPAVFNAQKNSISGAQTIKNSVDFALSTAETYANKISTNLTTMANDAAGFVELINKMNADDKAEAEADLASQVADANEKILKAQLTAYEAIVNDQKDGSIAKQIANLNNEIKEAKEDIIESEKKIAQYQLYIDGVFGNINGNNPGNQVNLEKLIADAEVEIDQYKAKVAALKDQVAAAKAALDAALAAE